ncbi:A24 family peptidase [Niveispirillum sp.]|uniref:prepilin peptidase n=1 Tax=Niveispirillum sp. TaxID=1917217 RepID=UPI001B50D24D|nr:A24 family peptidase [Niveispirillum sp.]MBP7340181.1 prepilin peptidase [Niveispirillum sp.]
MSDPLPLFFALTGACFGSLTAAMAWRLPRGVTVWGRSACPSCGHVLGPLDLIPLLSWLLLRGRCRHCHTPVSAAYPLIEGGTALFWTLCALLLPDPVLALTVSLLGTCLLFLALVDARWRYLPDAGVLLVALLALVPGRMDVIDSLSGGLTFGFLALGVRWLVGRHLGREALGLGDVKLMAAAGLWLGPFGLPPFLILSGLTGIGQVLLLRAAGRQTSDGVPFGPALSLSLLACVLLPIP